MLKELLGSTLNFIKNNPRENAKFMPSRLGGAAVGRIYNNLIRLVTINPLTVEEMNSTLMAVYGYMHNADYTPDGYVKREIFDVLKAQVDKSAERSAKARQRAAMRKAARESVVVTPPAAEEKPVEETKTPAAVTAVEDNADEVVEAVEAVGAVETAGTVEVVEAVEAVEETPETKPVAKPRLRREPDTIVSNYRPKKKPLPRYRVLTDEEMNAEPYDPFGAHRAYEIQCGRRRRW